MGGKGTVVLVWTVLLVLLSWWDPPATIAQRENPERFSESLERAESYLNQGKYEDGIIILEKLQRQKPRDPEVLRLLRRGYQRSKNYGKLLDLLQAGLPNTANYAEDVSLIADCWFKLDQIETAESTLTALLTPPPADQSYHDQAARTYLRNGRYLKAVEIYELARDHFGQPRLFSRQLADLYEARREYAKAIMEYFWDLQENPRSLSAVQRKIAAIVRMEEGTSELAEALRHIVAEYPENFHAHRLYAELLLESGDPEAAWPEYLAADNLAENPSDHILYFITRCIEDGHFSSARRSCLVFFERYPDHQRMLDVKISYARALSGLDRPDSAVAILQEIAHMFPIPEHKAETYLEIGNIYLDELGDPDSAETFFRRALSAGSRVETAFAASMRLGDCLLIRGDLAGADSAYAACTRLRLRDEQSEVVQFKRAELLFFTEKFDSVGQALKALIAGHPSGFYVNDAIILNLRVDENREPMDWSLKKFAAASLCVKRKCLDSAQALFWELTVDSTNALADDALFELGRVYAETGRPDSAVMMYGLLGQRYPDGFLMPAALTAQGLVYAERLHQPDSARAAYRRVLTEFADSPYLEEARRRLKGLGTP